MLIRLGDSDVDYDPNFRFYMTTKLPNPHYLPEVCIKVNLINFTVTIKGLEDQLLGEVVRKERPELEEARDRLVLSISNDKRQLAELEDKVLKLLRESSGNILDDEVLINTLNNSKTTSSLINARVKEAEETEKAINTAREVYRPVPIRASILYFVIADLVRRARLVRLATRPRLRAATVTRCLRARLLSSPAGGHGPDVSVQPGLLHQAVQLLHRHVGAQRGAARAPGQPHELHHRVHVLHGVPRPLRGAQDDLQLPHRHRHPAGGRRHPRGPVEPPAQRHTT